jgi:Na+-driven multidrug efflux pump
MRAYRALSRKRMNDTVCAYLLVLKPLADLLGSLHAEGFWVESQLVLALAILICVWRASEHWRSMVAIAAAVAVGVVSGGKWQ